MLFSGANAGEQKNLMTFEKDASSELSQFYLPAEYFCEIIDLSLNKWNSEETNKAVKKFDRQTDGLAHLYIHRKTYRLTDKMIHWGASLQKVHNEKISW